MATIIQATIGQLLLGTSVLAILLSVIQWLLANWIKIRLEQSIRHEYDKKLEDYRFSQLQRQKAETIATFFAKWIKYRGHEKDFLDEKELINYYEELNKMSLELSLWIKDEQLLNEIMSRTQMNEKASDTKAIVGMVRKMILEIKRDKFNSQNITLWPSSEETNRLFKLDKKG
ncbi:MAG: hypothetical protein M1575_02170 [Patescibacteria group bacterium]|nr:hypothetical protein [Patescibacteria group bacterium]